ncbi:efflux RND transporter periplasmic adaptor subunit [uncultured Paludibaculum sp.]|uniref:efflux RND transporter periplasmic adaptor subunit n=1 Tax=uncultured Paludibaculum sp. TaxID=1765020 RepID=UPI002AAA9804|nr:efflux RND transporter periplasmic adaptor subunit [uncultured Paludibaculum sp.]
MRIIATLMLAGMLAACSRKEEVEAAAPRPQPRPGEVILPADSPKLKQIKVSVVGTAQVPLDEVDAPGKLEVNPNRVSRVVTPVAGRITQVFVKLGDAVKEGAPVATIESPDADVAISAYLQADSSLGQMKANQLKAQSDFERNRDLLEHQAVARKELLTAENALAQAKAQVEQAVAAREQSLRRLGILGLKPGEFGQKITLRAPVSGKVLEMNVVQGEFRNDTNQPLLTVADLSTVWVSSDVPETAIRFIKVGEALDIELSAYPNEHFHAAVRRIADSVEPTTRTVKVRAELQNPAGRLLPEMFGRVRHVETMAPMAAIPAQAILQGQSGTYVYRETQPGRYQQTQIQTGNRAGDLVGVPSGLKPGDRIVTDGVMLLKGN